MTSCCMRMLDSQAFLIPKGTMCFFVGVISACQEKNCREKTVSRLHKEKGFTKSKQYQIVEGDVKGTKRRKLL